MFTCYNNFHQRSWTNIPISKICMAPPQYGNMNTGVPSMKLLSLLHRWENKFFTVTLLTISMYLQLCHASKCFTRKFSSSLSCSIVATTRSILAWGDSWVPGVENECELCSSPHTAIRWEIQLSLINSLTILINKQRWHQTNSPKEMHIYYDKLYCYYHKLYRYYNSFYCC